jgi:hypothetical protein
MIIDFNAKCMLPRAQPLPLETRQTRITEFFKVSRKVSNNECKEQQQLRMAAGPKRYTSDKISFYYRSFSVNNEW